MQEIRHVEGYKDPWLYAGPKPERLLEDTDGVSWLYSPSGKRIGKVHGRKSQFDYELIVWEHSVALMLLQGASVPLVTEGLLLERGAHRPPWHPQPGVEGALFRTPG